VPKYGYTEQTAAHVSRVISSAPSNAAESARPSSGSAQQDTKLYTPTDGRPVGFVDVVDIVDAVVLVVKVEVESVVLVVEVEIEVEDCEEVVADEEEEVIEDMEEGVVEGEEDVVEDDEEATEVVVVAEEFDDLSW
jgi:hypothetical protein